MGGYTPFSAIPYNFDNEFACDKPHYPFELPKGWCWTTVDDIYFVTKLAGFEYTEYFRKEAISPMNAVPIVRAQNVKMGRFIENKNEAITKELSEQLPRSALYKDCLLMTFIGAGVGETCIFHANKRNHLAPNVAKIEPFDEHINMEYALSFFMSSLGQLGVTNISKSTAQASLSMATIRELVIPIPPIKEQSRIANEVAKWFSLIECIEENKGNLQETIKQTKSKILDLAIHGKLVPKDPTDEPASELLKRINPKAEITCDNPQYGKLLPDGWCMTNIGSLFEAVSAKRVLKSEWKNKGIPFYRAREIVQLNKEGFADKDLFISEEHYAELKEKYGVPICGDIMISAVGSIGYTYIVRKEDVFYYKDASVLCLKNTNHWNPTFFTIWLASPFLQEQMYKNSKGTTVDTITLEKLKGYALPFPPIKEQQRIVAKIEELFAQLDNIASSL